MQYFHCMTQTFPVNGEREIVQFLQPRWRIRIIIGINLFFSLFLVYYVITDPDPGPVAVPGPDADPVLDQNPRKFWKSSIFNDLLVPSDTKYFSVAKKCPGRITPDSAGSIIKWLRIWMRISGIGSADPQHWGYVDPSPDQIFNSWISYKKSQIYQNLYRPNAEQ